MFDWLPIHCPFKKVVMMVPREHFVGVLYRQFEYKLTIYLFIVFDKHVYPHTCNIIHRHKNYNTTSNKQKII